MKWISVKDKMPQNYGDYCVVSDGVIQVAALWYDEFCYVDQILSHPIQWKPIKIKFKLSWPKMHRGICEKCREHSWVNWDK